jgi:hypothetical protein
VDGLNASRLRHLARAKAASVRADAAAAVGAQGSGWLVQSINSATSDDLSVARTKIFSGRQPGWVLSGP